MQPSIRKLVNLSNKGTMGPTCNEIAREQVNGRDNKAE